MITININNVQALATRVQCHGVQTRSTADLLFQK